MDQDKLNILQDWIKQHVTTHCLSVFSNRFGRDFSDGVLLAQLIKELYPKMIDLHNYPSRNAHHLKLTNWDLLNRKVLRKLNLLQTAANLERLAKGEPGLIEKILYELMTSHEASKIKQKSLMKSDEICRDLENDIMIISTNKQVGDALIQIPQKMILYSNYEKALDEIDNRDKRIAYLNQKITHLENLLDVKLERISDLTRQLERNILHRSIDSSSPKFETKTITPNPCNESGDSHPISY